MIFITVMAMTILIFLALMTLQVTGQTFISVLSDRVGGLVFSAHKQMLPSAKICEWQDPRFRYLEHALASFNFSNNDPLTEHAVGVAVTKHSLVIQHTGLYHVHCSVYFKTNRSAESPAFYVLQTSHENHADVKILLKGEVSGYGNPERYDMTVYKGDTFYLKAGDKIQVCIRNPFQVHFTKESTFLGLVMLSAAASETRVKYEL